MSRRSSFFQLSPSGCWFELPPPEVDFGTWINPTPFIDIDLTDLNLCPGPSCLLNGQPHEHAIAPKGEQ